MKRSPAAAMWLSLLPGAGHVYIGQASKGLVLVVLAGLAIHLADRGPDGSQLLIPFIWLFSISFC